MIRYLLIVLGILALCMCGSATEDIQAEEPNEELMSDSIQIDTLTYLALGDSYTIGEAVEVDERWPVIISNRFATDSLIRIENPRIIARTGWTTAELKQGIAAANLGDQKYDLVSLLIGVNNQFRGLDENTYFREFEALLVDALAFARGDTNRVFIVSIPDYGVTPFSANRNPEKIGREIDRYNEINKGIAQRYGVCYFDITPISREAVTDPELIASDGLHPSGKMYARWVDEVIMETLREKLINKRD